MSKSLSFKISDKEGQRLDEFLKVNEIRYSPLMSIILEKWLNENENHKIKIEQRMIINE